MSRSLRAHAAALSTACALTPVWGQSSYLDVPGPTGLSWIAITGLHERTAYDFVATGYGGRTEANGREVDVSGKAAVGNRVDIEGSLRRSTYRATTTVLGTAYPATGNANAWELGIRTRPIGSPRQLGFSLVTGASFEHVESGESTRTIDIEPQYRFTPYVLGVGKLILASSERHRSQQVQLHLVNRVSPWVTLTPVVGWLRADPHDAASRQGRFVAFDARWHLNRQLTLIGLVSGTRLDDTPANLPTRPALHDHTMVQASLGARWNF